MSQPEWEEDNDKQLARMAAQLGQHRGRRLIALLLGVGVLAAAGHALSAGRSGWGQAPQCPPAAEVALAPAAKTSPAVRKPVRKRAAKARVALPKAAPAPAALAVRPVPPPAPTEAVAAVPAPAEPTPEPLLAEPLHAEPVPAPAEPPPEPLLAEPLHAEPSPAEPAPEPGPEGNGEEIARRIAAGKRAAIQECFERELKHSPKLRGSMMVELDLAPSQRVDDVRVVDDLGRPAFTRCVSTTMHDLTFLALNEEVSIQLPFILTAR